MNPQNSYKLTVNFIYFIKILSADGHIHFVKTFTGRSGCEVITAVVETIHTAQEANVRG